MPILEWLASVTETDAFSTFSSFDVQDVRKVSPKRRKDIKIFNPDRPEICESWSRTRRSKRAGMKGGGILRTDTLPSRTDALRTDGHTGRTHCRHGRTHCERTDSLPSRTDALRTDGRTAVTDGRTANGRTHCRHGRTHCAEQTRGAAGPWPVF